MRIYFKIVLLINILFSQISLSQVDTIKYHWPVSPLTSSHGINGTFCEFRNTGSADHFHNAVDIGKDDGEPVYACLDGVVYSTVTNGYNSYINVKSIFGFQKKHITYYHVVPNPSLSVGDNVIKGQTIVGTIASGAGHVHLIERELLLSTNNGIGVEINPIRNGGGLTPYVDTYPPSILVNTIQFRKNESNKKISQQNLNGKVDIIIEVKEKNGGFSVNTNNGTYQLGYRVWNADTSVIVYEPDDNGTKYKFDRKPDDGFVHKVYVNGMATISDPVYWLTNGNGASAVNINRTVSDNYFDTDKLAEGNYVLEIFSGDTRSNFSRKYFKISINKNPPELLIVKPFNSQGLFVKWSSYSSPLLKGYRLYYSSDSTLQNWKLAADETTLHAGTTEIVFNNKNEFINPTDIAYYYYLTAVDSSGSESKHSDIYSVYSSADTTNAKKILIVDGFDRFGNSGSWKEPNHAFNVQYFKALMKQGNVSISSCANEAIIDKLIDLKNYDFVIWFVGDESREDNTFTNPEQGPIAYYLEAGGNVLITGDDIGYDLDEKHEFSEDSDTLFYRHYLKSRLIHTGNTLLTQANGVNGTSFENLKLNFGVTYPEDSPDDIEPNDGGDSVLNYNYFRLDNVTYRKAGVAYTGTFGNGKIPGKMIYISFALETLVQSQLDSFMVSVFNYLDLPTGIKNKSTKIPDEISLYQNYPNPFNPTTTISYAIPIKTQNFASAQYNVKLIVYDVLGREVATLVNKKLLPGNYKVIFNGKSLPSGVYYYKLQAGDIVKVNKMILLK